MQGAGYSNSEGTCKVSLATLLNTMLKGMLVHTTGMVSSNLSIRQNLILLSG